MPNGSQGQVQRDLPIARIVMQAAAGIRPGFPAPESDSGRRSLFMLKRENAPARHRALARPSGVFPGFGTALTLLRRLRRSPSRSTVFFRLQWRGGYSVGRGDGRDHDPTAG